MHNYPSFLINTYEFPSSILHPALDTALRERYKSVEDSPDESNKRRQHFRCPRVHMEQYLEADFNYVKTERSTVLAVCL